MQYPARRDGVQARGSDKPKINQPAAPLKKSEPLLTRAGIVDAILAAYIHLWILEGALRKWVAPNLDTILYVARDAFLVGGFILVFTRRGLRRPTRLDATFVLAFLATLIALLLVIQLILTSLPVALGILGLRAYLGPILLIILVARNLTEDGALRAQRAILLWAPLQMILTIAQVLSPQQSLVNQVAPGEYQAIAISGDIYRATGTFTAPIGLTVYTTLALAVALGSLTESHRNTTRPIHRHQLRAALFSIFIVTAASGSRALIAAAAAIVFALLLARIPSKSRIFNKMAIAAGLAITPALLFIQSVFEAFSARVEDANRTEDLTARIVDSTFGYLYPENLPSILGDGFGSHAIFAPTYGVDLGWIEPDLLRMTAEAGFLGLALALLRTTVAIYLTSQIVSRKRSHSVVFIALSGAAIPTLLAGSIIAQPSTQGAAAITFALLAAPTVRRTL